MIVLVYEMWPTRVSPLIKPHSNKYERMKTSTGIAMFHVSHIVQPYWSPSYQLQQISLRQWKGWVCPGAPTVHLGPFTEPRDVLAWGSSSCVYILY